MKKKNMMNKCAYAVAGLCIVLAVLVPSACFSPYQDDSSMGTIVIGGSSYGKAAADPGHNYTVILSGPGQTIQQDLSGLQASFKVVPGAWDVEVWGYVSGAKASLGRSTVTVQAGKSASADIKMALYHEASSAADLNFPSFDVNYDHWVEVTGPITTSSPIAISSALRLTLSSNGSAITNGSTTDLMSIAAAATLILRNITLQTVTSRVLQISNTNARVIMETGALITGKNSISNGAVFVDAGTLEMRAGSEISGNTTLTGGFGGGVYLTSSGILIMNGGTIRENTALNQGGGVYVGGGTVIMNDGTVAGNNANSGAGIYLASAGFTKTGGVIYGNDVPAPDRNLASSSGHAIYDSVFANHRENTVWGNYP